MISILDTPRLLQSKPTVIHTCTYTHTHTHTHTEKQQHKFLRRTGCFQSLWCYVNALIESDFWFDVGVKEHSQQGFYDMCDS